MLNGMGRRPTVAEVAPRARFACGGARRTLRELHDERSVKLSAQALQLAERIKVEGFPGVVAALGAERPAGTLSVRFLGASPDSDETAVRSALAQLEGATLVIVDGWLERARDPRTTLRALKRFMLGGADRRAIISGNDRLRGEGGPALLREWSAWEMEQLLAGHGFNLDRNANGQGNDYAFAVSLQRREYDLFLSAQGLPPSRTARLILSTEHGRSPVTGGIGSYVEEKLKLAQGNAALALLAPDPLLPPGEFLKDQQIITAQVMGSSMQHLPADNAFDLLSQVVAYYPDLVEIESQDFQGLPARTLQARKAGLFPEEIRISVTCHGNALYVENALGRWHGTTALPIMGDERIAVEQADEVVFPTRYLQRFYEQCGVRLDPARLRYQRYPFAGMNHAEPSSTEADTVIFFGKRTRMKGFSLFIAALEKLLEGGANRTRLKRLILLGPKDETLGYENSFVERLRSTLEVTEVSLPRAEAMKLLADNGPRAICVTPYTADNHPVSVLEVIASGCQLVATATGGIPELIPAEVRGECLVRDTPLELMRGLDRALGMSGPARSDLVRRVRAAANAEQEQLNRDIVRQLEQPPVPREVVRADRGDVTVMIPCFNSDLAQLRETIWSLNQQTLAPAKVLFVDDGSEAPFFDRLRELVQETCAHPFEVLRHEANRGLAAARNTALAHTRTRYVVNLDSDDIAKNDFLECYVRALDADPSSAAVSSFLDYFDDGRDWRFVGETLLEQYRPVGEGVVRALTENCLGHANSGFRVDRLREVGGWDESDRSMWEDWALLLKLHSGGHRITVIPRSVSLYRCRPQSMARTYPKHPAERRLARALVGLDRHESLLLQGTLREHVGERDRLREQAQHYETRLNAEREAHAYELSRIRHLLGRHFAELIDRRPELARSLRISLDTVRVQMTAFNRVARRMKHALGNGSERS